MAALGWRSVGANCTAGGGPAAAAEGGGRQQAVEKAAAGRRQGGGRLDALGEAAVRAACEGLAAGR